MTSRSALLCLAVACSTPEKPQSTDTTDPSDTDTVDTLDPVDPADTPGPAETDAPEVDPVVTAITTAPLREWTWVDVPGMRCADGTPTGIGVNRSDTSPDMLVFATGGGACWDLTTCTVLRTAISGPYGADQLSGVANGVRDTILDRSIPDTGVADATQIFVPSCTGDMHAGDVTADFDGTPWYFAGRPNLTAALQAASAAFPDAPRVVVTGLAGGGFGAALAWPDVVAAWPTADRYLLQDSFLMLVGAEAPATTRDAWVAAWGLTAAFGTDCPTCAGDLSAWYTALTTAWPEDRFAVLSHTQDATFASYMGLRSADLEAAQLHLRDAVLEPAGVRSWLAPGTGSTVLIQLSTQQLGDDLVADWVRAFVTDDPTFGSRP